MAAHTFAVAVVTALTLLLLLLHAFPCAAARPMPTRPATSGTSALAVPPSAAEGAQWRAADTDAAARAGKWLPYPYAGGVLHRYPGYPRYYTGYPEGKPMMWAGGAPPALGAYGASGGQQLGKSPYADETRQEQVAMWASLLNPAHGPTTPTSWMPANGGDEPADQARDEAKALDGAAEGTEMDVPAGGGGVQTGGQPKWGLYPGNSNGK